MVDEESAGSSGENPPTDALYTILASETRRQVLRYFQVSEDTNATLTELADFLVTQDSGVDDLEKAKITLHHLDLPKLARYGAVDYDPRSNAVSYLGQPRLEEFLFNHQIEWSQRAMELVTCLSCGEFVIARKEEDSLAPLKDECPNCDEKKFKDTSSGKVIQTD
ncbi:DUF7344 domain-containing protein [Haloprofundus salinisoli]|uniref:DUF7344 domain-containing protein n=1 Tax=Haloprofundus salinisoli TaxID=2876193 RepID=UPI001CC9DB23|nr:hypothetical protein [Haloprofundus salinisoli]